MGRYFEKGQTVLSRGGEHVGVVMTGNEIHCTLEGCRGVKAAVKWPDGKRTYLCSRGLGPGKKTTFRLL